MKIVLLLVFILYSQVYPVEWKFANGPYCAEIRKMAINPIHPDTIYATGNGLFRTYDGGQNWLEITPDSLIGNIENAVAIDPKYTNIIYYGNRALFKSYDFGSSWEISGFLGRKVTSITIDPVETNNIYIGLKDAHENGDALWLSNDFGKTWHLKTSGMPIADITSCRTIEINPLNRKNIYAGTTWAGLFKSEDYGDTWIYIGFAGLIIRDIAIASWDTSIIFTATWAGLFKSKDRGLSWYNVLNADIRSVEIDSQNRIVYAGLYWGDGVYKSIDYGETWQDINNPFLPTSYSMAMDVFDIRIDPKNPDNVYIGTGIGPYKTENAGNEWNQVFNGMKKFYAFDIKISPSDSNIIYATGRNGVHRSNDSGASWKYIGGLGVFNLIEVHPSEANIVFITNVGIDMFNRVFKTINGGLTWEYANAESPTIIPFIRVSTNPPYPVYTSTFDLLVSYDYCVTWQSMSTPFDACSSIEFIKGNDKVIYIGSLQGVFISLDSGESWSSLGLSNKGNILVAGNPVNSNIIYSSIYGFGFYKTTNSGETWKEKNDGLFDFNITRLIINPKYPDEILLGTETNGVFFSKNAGESWKQLQPYHPSLRIDALCIGRDGKLFCAGRDTAGIYVLDSVLTSIKQEDVLLNTTYLLEQNYPNPFNNSTLIEYFLPVSGTVKLVVYDLLGRRIRTLVNSYQTPGRYNVKWDGKDNSGNVVSSGLYFYQLTAGEKSLNSKMLLIK